MDLCPPISHHGAPFCVQSITRNRNPICLPYALHPLSASDICTLVNQYPICLAGVRLCTLTYSFRLKFLSMSSQRIVLKGPVSSIT